MVTPTSPRVPRSARSRTMSPQAVAAPNMEIQGEEKELFSRVQRPSITSRYTSRPVTSDVHVDRDAGTRVPAALTSRLSVRPSTTGHGNAQGHQQHDDILPEVSYAEEGVTEHKRPDAERALPDSLLLPKAKSSKGGGIRAEEKKPKRNVNETKSKLLGGYLRARLLDNIDSPEPAKELVRRSFRHLHRGQGHILSLEEFKEGLANTFGVLIPLQLIRATFEMFDTEPRTWQLDFDEFYHWLETGERSLNSHGVSASSKPAETDSSKPKETQGRKKRSNETSSVFKSIVRNPEGMGMGMSTQQKDRAALKAHLMKYKNRLHTSAGLTEAQKSVVDHILLEKIKAIPKTDPSSAEAFDSLEEFKAFASGSDSVTWNGFKRKVVSMLPDLVEESDVKDVFSRMDHNGDGVVDLTDFLMWEERMQEGRANTDFWTLREEQHIEEIKLRRSKASNLLVPDDYDGSTYFAKTTREKAKKKRADIAEAAPEHVEGDLDAESTSRKQIARALRDSILSQVNGGSLEVLRAFRHFRPAAIGRRLFMNYMEFRESIKHKGLGLSEEDTKKLFRYFDEDDSGEIDFSEFRRFLQEGMEQTGLQMGGNHHEEKMLAARKRMAALANSALDPTLAGGAKSDQLLKDRVLRRITGRQGEILKALRRFGTEEGKGAGSMDYADFAGAIAKSGFNLSTSETKQVFNKFRLTGESESEPHSVPTGEMNAHAFRDWLLESNISTGLDVGNIVGGNTALSAEQAVEQIGLSDLHRKLRGKVAESFKSDHRNLLRAFRGLTRKKGSDISIEEFREAVKSFGLGEDKVIIDKLFDHYDWRRRRSIRFQELMEILTKSSSLPRQLTTAERKFRLNEEKKVSDEVISKLENAIRTGLWKKYLDDAEACHRAIARGSEGGLVGLTALQTAARIAGISGERSSDNALKQLLRRNTETVGENGCRGWNKADFIKFYRPANCWAAMSALKARNDDNSHSDADAKRAQLIGEANRARAQLLGQVRRLSNALTKIDKPGTGKVSRKTFAQALAKEGGLGKVGEMELTRFTSAVRIAEPATVIAAVAAAETAAPPPQTIPAPRKRGARGEGPVRWASNPQLAILPPRPSTVAAATGGKIYDGDGERNSTDSRHVGITYQAPAVDDSAKLVAARARTAELGQRRRVTELKETENKVATPLRHGYLKSFGADSARTDHKLLMEAAKRAPPLPNLVGQRSELPKTTPLHRAMRKDVMRSVTELKSAFKKCESPYRRGIVSVTQFQAVCRKNGVTVDKEDVAFLLKLHRHKLSYGGKYAVAPTWMQAPSSVPSAVEMAAHAAAAPTASLRYDEFLRTCQAASDTITAPVH